MKKFLFTLVMSIVALLGLTTVTSCDSQLNKLCSRVDTTQVATIVDQCINPQFKDADGFVNYAKDELLYQKFITTVATLSPTTVKIIASKCISDYGCVDYQMFLEEYATNKSVYDNVEITNRMEVPKEEERATTVIHLDTVPPIVQPQNK